MMTLSKYLPDNSNIWFIVVLVPADGLLSFKLWFSWLLVIGDFVYLYPWHLMIMLEGSGCYLNLLFQQAVTWFRFGTDSCLVWGPLVLKTDKPLEHMCYPGLLGSPGAPGASAHLCMYCLMGRKELLEARPPIPLRDQGVGHGHLRPIETIRFPSCPLVVGSPWSVPSCFLVSLSGRGALWPGREENVPWSLFVSEFLDLSISLACAAGSTRYCPWVICLIQEPTSAVFCC